jgi:glucose/arabinose dehydrogenase
MMYRMLAGLAFLMLAAGAATVPTNFTESVVVSGLSSPTAFAFAPDGSGRIFVCQQGGALRVIQNGALVSAPFVTVPVDSQGERGLLGIAFDPEFTANQYVYLYYTLNSSPRRNRVVRFTANGNVAASGSEVVLLELENLTSATNHNGGAMHFGTDGKLYVAVGDNATGANSALLTNKLGKVLRMNKDGSIPSDNPFFLTATGTNRLIWVLGLRNPYTFAIQRGTGRTFVNDVGQNTWEEINDAVAGNNFGWPSQEGPGNVLPFIRPIYAYQHQPLFGGGGSCAITGGDFYNPVNPEFPSTFAGKYFFADFCGGWMAYLDPATSVASPFLTGGSSIVDLRTNADGSLYYLQRGDGSLRRIAFTGITQPSITSQPSNVSVAAGLNATFQVTATGGGLGYQWQRNNVPIGGATGSTYTLNNAGNGDNGAQFRVVVTNTAGSVTSNVATLTVTTNQPPSPVILTPAAGVLFSGGDTILFAGSASDPETGDVAVSGLRWRVDYHTGSAVRPFVQEFSGAASGSFVVPAITPYTLTDVFFRIYLTARDPFGNEVTVTRDVLPRVSQLSLVSAPAGLTLTLDGQPFAAPLSVSSVVGLVRPIGAASPQQNGGTRRVFQSWSDGGAPTHDITVPLANATYTATFGTEHLLTVSGNPANGGTVGGGGWFAAGTTATVSATAAAGWQFTGYGGTAGPSVVMDGPKTVTANFVPNPGMLAVSVVSKANGAAADERVWNVRFANLGQGPVVNARLAGILITPTGLGAVALLSPLPVALGTIAPGGSVIVPLTFRWPVTSPTTRARMEFGLAGDFGYATTVTMNSLFR